MRRYLLFFLLILLATARLSAQQPEKPYLRFERNPDQQFGFNSAAVPEWEGELSLWTNAPVMDYHIPWKSVGAGEQDVVDAELIHADLLNLDSLVFFVSGTDEQLPFFYRDKEHVTINLPAKTKNYTVTAFSGTHELGRLNVAVYAHQTEKVIVVPLVDTHFDYDTLSVRLNRIYRQANISLKIEVKPVFVHEELDPEALFDNPGKAHDRYTNQMRNIRDLYFDKHPDADRKAYYVFLVEGFKDPAVRGYMVTNKSMAFVKAGSAASMTRTMARQLGRGIGFLKDSWLYEGPEQGSTDNLMDQARGITLRYVQWEDLRHTNRTFSFYDNYEDVRTNNGFVAYYFWKEDAKGNIVLESSDLLQAVKRPYKKNYFSYHLNITSIFFKTLFTINGRLICFWHIVAVILVFAGIYLLWRKTKPYINKRLKRPGIPRFASRIIHLAAAIYLSYLSFLFVNLGYGWFEVRSGWVADLDQQSVTKAMLTLSQNYNYKHPSEPNLRSELLIRREKGWYKTRRKPVLYFSVRQDKRGYWTRMRLQSHGDSLNLPTLDFSENAQSHYIVLNYMARDGSFERQRVFNHLGMEITDKLKLEDPAKRILLFVNGYRPTSIGHTFEENFQDIRKKGLEFPDSRNLVYTFDRYDYWRPWQGIDLLFQKRINPVETFYADGHFSVSTSNHRSLINFTTTSSVYPKRCSNSHKHHCYQTNSMRTGLFGNRMVETIKLHNRRPNRRGFRTRLSNGRIAGRNIYQMLNELPNGSANDTLIIVAHSMGYAYALGIIEELRGKIQFGALYIIAPENASCGDVNLGEWEEVWQYGSNFNTKHHDAPCLLDGVAPQVKAGGLRNKNRVYIPRTLYRKKGFFDSHFIGYYTWVLDIPEGKPGWIRQR